jgi:hypothetical protein
MRGTGAHAPDTPLNAPSVHTWASDAPSPVCRDTPTPMKIPSGTLSEKVATMPASLINATELPHRVSGTRVSTKSQRRACK